MVLTLTKSARVLRVSLQTCCCLLNKVRTESKAPREAVVLPVRKNQNHNRKGKSVLLKCKTAQSVGESTGLGSGGPLDVRVGGRYLENPFPMPQNPVKF